jgi:hypothetical protein
MLGVGRALEYLQQGGKMVVVHVPDTTWRDRTKPIGVMTK